MTRIDEYEGKISGSTIFVTHDEYGATVTDDIGSTFTDLGDGCYERAGDGFRTRYVISPNGEHFFPVKP